MTCRVFIALGSNLQDPAMQVRQALSELDQLPGTRIVASSPLYCSAPVGYDNQPDFINAVAEVATDMSPRDLLQSLLTLEAAHGRERPFPNAPRELDLDLLLYGELTIREAMLTLPHPRMHERGFVLYPLADIAPDINIPGKGSVTKLLLACPDLGLGLRKLVA